MSVAGIARWILLITIFSGIALAQPERPIRRPPNNELALETIEAPVRPDAPDAVQGLAARLVFHVSPLSGKGLLSQQIRDALKALDKANGNTTFLKLRAFVAGTGDVRRVQSIVTEEFSDQKRPLPAITTVQVGALPLENAHVVIESISEERSRTVNPAGLVFLPGQYAEGGAAAVARLEEAMRSASASAVRLSCFADSLEQARTARTAAAKAFPGAAGTFVQTTRAGLGSRVSCEGVGRVSGRIPAAGAPARLVFTGIQMSFAGQDGAAYDRLGKALGTFGAAAGDVLFTNRYTVVGHTESPAPAFGGKTMDLVIEGLPALDATVAIEVVAAGK